MAIFGVDSAHGGDDWFARTTSTLEEIGTIWSGFGSNSEYGQLKRAMLHMPGEELSEVTDPKKFDWYDQMDLSKAIRQIDTLAETYSKYGVDVQFLEPAVMPRPNHIFVRDLFCMTPYGAILSRMAGESRKGEEVDTAIALAKNSIPIVSSVQGSGVFEGPDLLFYSNNKAFLAESIRSNLSGISQVQGVLSSLQIDVCRVETTFGCGHLDGVVSIVNSDLALIHPRRVSYPLCQELTKNGFKVVALPNEHEANHNMAINMVSINPELVVIIDGNLDTEKLLNSHGVETISINLSEVMKGGGGVHCVTGIIERQSV